LNTSPSLRVEPGRVFLAGRWTLAAMQASLPALQHQLKAAAEAKPAWDLSGVERLDSAAATLLWRAWGDAWPAEIALPDALRETLQRVAKLGASELITGKRTKNYLNIPGRLLLAVSAELYGVTALFGQLLLDIGHLFRHPGELPWKEFTANVYKAGAQALPVTALVGFLIGVTISYLSALQLRSFGADIFIVNILGMSIIRELGPVLVAVLVAGRSGSAMTAQIGVMRVTEEIDALSTMGVSRTVRVVLPKIAGLTAAMPLLVLWTSASALLGGMLAALLQLDLSLAYFVDNLPRAVPVANLYIGLGKGVVFGFIIALLACHFGLRVKPNTESLAANTTTSVVSAITLVILVDAVFAILTKNIGLPSL
jgi:phospholipid/cholesterol/gamma-HCH transport system permease protein